MPRDMKHAIEASTSLHELLSYVAMLAEFKNDGDLVAGARSLSDVTHIFLLALNKCLSFAGFRILNQLIRSMMVQNIKMDIRTMDPAVWDMFFKIYFQRNDTIRTEFLRFVTTMMDHGSAVSPTVNTFNTMLFGIALSKSCKQPEIAEEIVEELMYQHNVVPNQRSFECLMHVYASNGYKVNYLKATKLLVKIHNTSRVSGGHSVVRSYKVCLRDATVSDYNQIIQYLYDSLTSTNLESSAIAELVFVKCM